MKKFQVYLTGTMYAFEIYDDRGREIFDLNTAAQQAQAQYGEDWKEVSNGIEGISRTNYSVRGPKNSEVCS